MKRYVVAYGYAQTFELTEREASQLVVARESGAKIVKFDDRVLSVDFTWLVPQEEVEGIELDSGQLKLCENVAEWLSRDTNGLDWSYEPALDYSKKLMKRIGHDEVKKLWNDYANGVYPSPKKFLTEAKQTSNLEVSVDTSTMLDSRLLE